MSEHVISPNDDFSPEELRRYRFDVVLGRTATVEAASYEEAVEMLLDWDGGITWGEESIDDHKVYGITDTETGEDAEAEVLEQHGEFTTITYHYGAGKE